MNITFDSIVLAVQIKYQLTKYEAIQAAHARLEELAGKKIAWEDRDIWVAKLVKKEEAAYNKSQEGEDDKEKE